MLFQQSASLSRADLDPNWAEKGATQCKNTGANFSSCYTTPDTKPQNRKSDYAFNPLGADAYKTTNSKHWGKSAGLPGGAIVIFNNKSASTLCEINIVNLNWFKLKSSAVKDG